MILTTLLLSFLACASEPFQSDQWALKNTGQKFREDITDIKSEIRYGVPGIDIGWERARALIKNLPQSEVIVAVLDSGVDYEHEDLKDNLAWNLNECPDRLIPIGIPKDDKDGNGFAGDCIGWDFTVIKEKEVRHRPLDSMGHGTHVAGIMAASTKNNIGVSGVSDKIRILPIRVTNENELRIRKPLSQRIAEGINYALLRGASVINISMGWPVSLNSQAVKDALLLARSRGVFVVTASGNNGHNIPVYPCAYKEVICVGSLRYDGLPSDFTNYGGHIDLLAPGDQILSTYPMNQVPLYYPVKGYEVKGGSSQAAPYVSSAFAVLKSLFPGETYEQILTRLTATAISVGSKKNFLAGRIQLDKAIEYRGEGDFRPSFKELSILSINANKELTIRLPIVNMSSLQTKKSVNLKLIYGSTKILDQTQELEITGLSEKIISISTKLPHLNEKNELKIEVSISGQRYLHEVLLGREVGASTGWQRFSFIDLGKTKQVFNVVALPGFEGKFLPSYSAIDRVQNGGFVVRLFKMNGTNFQTVGSQTFADAKFLPWVYSLDANGDGVEDHLVMTIAEVNEKLYFRLHYFDHNFNAFAPELTTITLSDSTDENFNFALLGNPERIQLIPTQFLKHKLLMPSVISSGLRPKSDRSKRERRNPELSRGLHYYFLEADNAGGLRTRVVDSDAIVQEIRSKLDLRFYDKIEPVTALDANRFLFRVGQLDNARPLVIENTGALWRWKLMDSDDSLINVQSFNVAGTDDLKALYTQITLHRAEFRTISLADSPQIGRKLIFDLPDLTEQILKPLLIAKLKSGLGVIVEAGQEMFGFLAIDNKVSVYRTPLARTTFFGERITQVTKPLLLDGEPSLYVDNSGINAANIFIWELTKSGFVSRAQNSHIVPVGCKSSSPVRWSGESGHRLAMICGEESEAAILFLPAGR